jgi:hypothetical protein
MNRKTEAASPPKIKRPFRRNGPINSKVNRFIQAMRFTACPNGIRHARSENNLSVQDYLARIEGTVAPISVIAI